MGAHFGFPLFNEFAFPLHPREVCFSFVSSYFSHAKHLPGGQCFMAVRAAKQLGEYLQLNKNGFW